MALANDVQQCFYQNSMNVMDVYVQRNNADDAWNLRQPGIKVRCFSILQTHKKDFRR